MNKRTAISIALAVGMAAAPLSAARAQTVYQAPYYYNPLFLPFLVAGAVLGTAALIVTLPVRVVCADCLPPPEAYYPFYAGRTTPAYPRQPVTYAPAYPPATGYQQPPITYSAPGYGR